MVLESTMVVIDNSDFMRNGDFLPTRLQAQQDAVGMVCQTKVRSNPENNVGLVVMSKVEVLVTLTQDVGRILSKLHQVQPTGLISFVTAIRVAHLALKHRQGRNHKTRIIVFVGSPMADIEKDIVKLAKKLKKEKVMVDVINFGEESNNTDKLTTFINTLNGAEGKGSHLVTVPPGPILSDALISSPIILGEEGAGVGPGMSSGGFEFGIDPNEDPELALALRVSMEEQRARQEADARRAATTAMTASEGRPLDDTKEESSLEAAVALSMQQNLSTPTPVSRDLSSMTEEEQIAFALQMSMGADDKDMEEEMMVDDDDDDDEEDNRDMLSDAEFLQNVLVNLPGVDPESAAIRNAVQSLTQPENKEDEDEKDEKGKEGE